MTSIKNTFSLENNLPFNKDVAVFFDEIENKEELKVLQNLPYARRGYIFTNQVLKDYYEKMPWYVPNKEYVPEPNKLEEAELKWLNDLEKIKLNELNETNNKHYYRYVAFFYEWSKFI